MALKDRLVQAGMFPDLSKFQGMFDQRFAELIAHIDDGFNRVVAAIQEQKGAQ